MRIPTKIAVALVATAVALLMCEGAASVVLARSVLRPRTALLGEWRLEMTDEERIAAARLTSGAFGSAVDPYVAMQLKGSFRGEFAGAEVVLDEFGMRERTGPPPEPGALRIALLGDSVAFGQGVDNASCPAHQLEDLLGRLTPEGRPKPVVFSVACPGWSFVNSFRFLKAHLGRIDPDIVLYLAVGNDLQDGYTVTEAGHRSMDYNPARPVRWPAITFERYFLLLRACALAAPPERQAEAAADGVASYPFVLNTGLAPESRRRWDDLVHEIVDLDRRMTARGGRFAVVFERADDFNRMLECRLEVDDTGVTTIPLLESLSAGDSLPTDPHANPRCIRAMAWRMADGLRTAGWLGEVDGARWPDQDPRYASRHMERLPEGAHREWLARYRERVAESLFDEIDLTWLVGVHQVLGGCHEDGTVGRNAALVVRNSGAPALELVMERLPASTGVYPLVLDLEIHGEIVATVEVPAPGETEDPTHTIVVPVPPGLRATPVLELLINASNWVWEAPDGVGRLASFRLRHLRPRND